MQQRVVRGGVVALVFSIAASGCGAQGNTAKHASAGDELAATSTSVEPSSAWSGASASPASSEPPPAVSATTPSGSAAASSAPPPPQRPLCPLVCNVANRGRVPAAEEARFTDSLASVTNALHACTSGPLPTMTLRFDSRGALTYFGLEEEETAQGATGEATCIDASRRQKPSLTFAGPATVRCAERCPR